MSKIILLSAKARHGKNYCANIMQNNLEQKGYKVNQDMFAKYIKGYLKDYYDWDGITKDEFYRNKLQQLGTERIKQELNFKSFHAKRLAEDIQICEDSADVFIITDTRFKDEIYTMKAMFPDDVLTVRIERKDNIGLEGYTSRHKSEIDLDDFTGFDYTISNYGDESFKTEVDNLCEEIHKWINKEGNNENK